MQAPAHQEKLISSTEAYVKQELAAAEGGHDWWHIARVRKSALHIAEAEKADLLIVELGALLHDIADAKFHDGDENIGPAKAREFLQLKGLNQSTIDAVEDIIKQVSFKGGHQSATEKSLELMVVQDADRLDAIGAVGIARCFNYGGFRNRAIYNPNIAPQQYSSAEAYRKSEAPSINHFYEKLLLLKDQMNTATGRKLAERRHQFMEAYLEQFYAEFNGER